MAACVCNAFYFDESGHSGDLTKTGVAFDFLDQPFFVLTAVGLDDATSIGAEVDAMRMAHRIQPGELKSKSLQSKPEFCAALFDMVLRHRLPLFVEVVDKKYFLCVNVVLWLLMPPAMSYPEGPQTHLIRNIFAQFLYEEVSDNVLDGFVQACLEPSLQSVANALGKLTAFAMGEARSAHNADFIIGLRDAVAQAEIEFEELTEEDASAYERFLPPPDLNPRGKKVWVLPNLSSFTNIYARINLFRHRDMSGVRFIHDQQLEVGQILEQGMAAVRGLKDFGAMPFTPHADYVIESAATLSFSTSHDELGVQLADVLSGTVMRYYRDRLRAPAHLHPAVDRVVRAVQRQNDGASGWGLNFVGPDQLLS
jgi:hypothetical protein